MENSQKKGRFIVFEGIDGAGKTTQIERLAEALRAAGRRVTVTAEPTDSVTGGLLRDALGGLHRRTDCEMAALFLADRVFHNVAPDGIRALRDQGYDVICDRYYYSSMAYQGSRTDSRWVRDINLGCPEIARPDLCLFLDLDPEESLRRIQKNRTSTEIYEKKDILEGVRKAFFDVFASVDDTVAVIDTTGLSIDQVAAKVFAEVEKVR